MILWTDIFFTILASTLCFIAEQERLKICPSLMEINYAKSSLTFTHLYGKEEREGGEELLRLKMKERKKES